MCIRDSKHSRQRRFGKTKDVMRIFEELTGIDFPFNKYDQTMVSRI